MLKRTLNCFLFTTTLLNVRDASDVGAKGGSVDEDDVNFKNSRHDWCIRVNSGTTIPINVIYSK